MSKRRDYRTISDPSERKSAVYARVRQMVVLERRALAFIPSHSDCAHIMTIALRSM
jgi:hypothetical protein